MTTSPRPLPAEDRPSPVLATLTIHGRRTEDGLDDLEVAIAGSNEFPPLLLAAVLEQVVDSIKAGRSLHLPAGGQ